MIVPLLFALFTPLTLAAGSVELVVSSPRTVIVETTVCADFQCTAPDDLSPGRKVHAGVPLWFQSGRYQGEARKRMDVHLKVIDPETTNELAMKHFRPMSSTDWNREPIVVQIADGFNVTVQLRNLCSLNYHGQQCGQFCVAAPDRHWECSADGQRQCASGWTGSDCSIPVCSDGCNGRGRCVSPGKCECAAGFNGTQCEKCIAAPGCVNGKCLNNMPMTCECLPGFVGAKCDIDINICRRRKPCQNKGKCSLDASTSSGFRCECPFGFFGPQCETPVSSAMRCADNADHVCQNGGTCIISLDEKSIQCKCPPGFSGRFCERVEHTDCSTLRCSNGATCRMMGGTIPVCVGTTTTPHTPRTLVIINNHHHHHHSEEQESQFFNSWIFFVCLISCIGGICLATRFVYIYFIAKSNRRRRPTLDSPLSTTTNNNTISTTTTSTPTKSRASPVYKVCIIDAETSGRDVEMCAHHHSPPPAYTSPARLYKSVPTHDFETFRDDSNV